MNSTLSKIQLEFNKNFLYPSQEWLSQCLEKVLSQSSSSSDVNKLCELILMHYLHYDLIISSSFSTSSSITLLPSNRLPSNLSFTSNSLILQNEWCLIQIEGIYNISLSKHKGKISSITSTEVNEEEEDNSEEEYEENELNQSIRFVKNKQNESKTNSLYGNMNKLLITDGFNQYIAYDLDNFLSRTLRNSIANTKNNDISLTIGTKLLISNVRIRHGSLILSNSIKILGGRSDYKELRKQSLSDSNLLLDFEQNESLLSNINTESNTNLSSLLSNFTQSASSSASSNNINSIISTSATSVSNTTSASTLNKPFLSNSAFNISTVSSSNSIPNSSSITQPNPNSSSISNNYESFLKKSDENFNNNSSHTPLENEHPIYQEEYYNTTFTPYNNKGNPSNNSNSNLQIEKPLKEQNSNSKNTNIIINQRDPIIIDISKESSSPSSSSLSLSLASSSHVTSSPSNTISNKLYYFSDILNNKEKFYKKYFYIHAYPIKLLKNKIEYNETTSSYIYNIVLLYNDGENNQIIKLSNNLCSNYLGLTPLEYKQKTQNDESKIKQVLRKFQSFSGIFKARILTDEEKEVESSNSNYLSNKNRDAVFLFFELSNNAILDICKQVFE